MIVGGRWGKNLIREFFKLNVLHTVCDTSPEVLDRIHDLYPGVKTTCNFKDVLHSETITAVCIALPSHLHYAFGKDVLQAGKDLFVEKPMTLNVADADDLVKNAEENGQILMVGHIYQYNSWFVKVKEFITAGKLGKIRTIVCNKNNLGVCRPQENALWWLAPHAISMVLSLTNDLPESVQCTGFSIMNDNIQDITNSNLMFEDMYVNINVSWLGCKKERTVAIYGERGILMFYDMAERNNLMFYPQASGDTITAETKELAGIPLEVIMSETPLSREGRHFTDCCLNRKQPITNGEEGREVVRVLSCLHSSMENGVPVELTRH